ncbi:hypothetical protein BN946_scf184909.g47 [Trametes cinnabarina]|uniref:Bud22 domain-containing protein n=1 Tax=Pycnoporus cinnabarinus TaxID=5643 RepID=A0A060SGB6_PYCCI|nr:hypothetical protein BN946_scf184909.g47 [Trametes cinnabarina]
MSATTALHEDSKSPRGTKRKRPTGEKPKGRPPIKRETPAELIPKKLHHGVHEVRKASKKAVAFELRKLVKRLKTARGEKPKKGNIKLDDPAELERQLDILKHIDHEPFANTTLKTKILKDHLLSENDDVKAAVAEKLCENLVQPQQPGSSAAKVHARILSSKTIADAVHAVVDSLKEIVDPSLAKAKAKALSREPESDAESGERGERVDDDADLMPVKGKKARLAASGAPDEAEEDASGSGSEAEGDAAGWESGTVDGEGDAAGWESGTVDGDGDGLRSGGSSEDGEAYSDEEESGDDASEDEDAAPEKPKGKAPPAKDRRASPKPGWPKKEASADAGDGSGGQKRKKSDDKPLHPSWEAKRKLKEKLNPSIVPAQGKKIKFS